MGHNKGRLSIFFVVASLLLSPAAWAAGWSVNFGYHNPPNSTFGINFMHTWSNWAVELGIGSLGSSSSRDANGNTTSDSFGMSGDANFKYRFGSGTFRPYLGAGVGLGTAATTGNNGGLSVGASGPFGLAGLLFEGSSIYFYVGGVFASGGSALQLGLGFNF